MRAVSAREGGELGMQFGCRYFETSAKTGENVKAAVGYVVQRVLQVQGRLGGSGNGSGNGNGNGRLEGRPVQVASAAPQTPLPRSPSAQMDFRHADGNLKEGEGEGDDMLREEELVRPMSPGQVLRNRVLLRIRRVTSPPPSVNLKGLGRTFAA